MTNPTAIKPSSGGWVAVGALFICAFMIYGAGMYSFMLFVPGLAEQFHWGPAAAGSLVSAFWVTAPLSLMTHRLIRRFGLRTLVTCGIVIEALALTGIFLTSHFWELYLLRVLAGLGKVCFAITLPFVLSRWFSDRFGTAIAIVYSGMFFSGTVFAPVTHASMASLGARGASIALGAAVIVVALPLALWILHGETGAKARSADGQRGGVTQNAAAQSAIASGLSASADRQELAITLRELWSNRDLQIIAVCRTLYYTVMAGPFVYQTTIVTANPGYAHTTSMLLGVTAGFIGAGELLSGLLIDRLRWRGAMLIQHALFGLGMVAMLTFTLTPTLASLVVYAACFGLAYGGSDPFWTTTLKRRLAPDAFQRAWGPVYFLGLAVSVLWPIAFGWLRDATGSYTVPLSLSLGLLVIPLMLSLVSAPRRA
jgi:MFS family permease